MTSARPIGLSRRELLKLASIVAFVIERRQALAEPRRGLVFLKPLGPAPLADAVAAARQGVEAIYGLDVRIASPMPLPRAAFYAPRGRYRAEVLIEALVPLLPPDGLRLIGMTSVDISTSKPPYADWGILGLATIGGATGVVSSFRCARRSRNAAHAAERFAKTVVHELGHTLGLPHCRVTPGCIMEDAGGSVLTTDVETDLCDSCRARVERNGYVLHRSAKLPWNDGGTR